MLYVQSPLVLQGPEGLSLLGVTRTEMLFAGARLDVNGIRTMVGMGVALGPYVFRAVILP